MKTVLDWIKGNVLTVIAILVVIGSFVALGMTHSRGAALMERIEERQGEIRRIENLFQTRVKLPPKDADGPTRERTITVNRQAIEQLERVYERMDEEYSGIFDYAIQVNREGHVPILDGLFPEPAGPSKPFDAQRSYLDSFGLMFESYSPNAVLPRLNAGGPVPREALEEEIAQVQQDYLQANFFGEKGVADLSETEVEKLAELKREAVLKRLESHARSIHVYAEDEPSASGYPFLVDGWSRQAQAPAIEEIWESQVNLWIQQDIVEAIARANRVSSAESNVMTAPVKRLVAIEAIEEGYTGITSPGLISTGSRLGLGEARGADSPLPDDFSISSTGRRSNDIYDVRHVKVRLVVDYQRLPELFDAISQVNFMTLLHIEFSQVDEYEALRQGYVYGSGDAVEAVMVIETLWLRDWTTEWMPESVQRRVGAILDDEEDE